ncbi:MAG: proline-rich domain-containing protein [Nocardioidaceae bacterium]
MDAVAIDELDGQQCADALVAEVAHERAAAARRLLLIGQWATIHNEDTLHARHDATGRLLPGTEQARTYGGDGTPMVAEFAVHELALLLGVPERVAAGQLGDVLDLVHRHPQLWARVHEAATADAPGADPALAVGLVQAWQATYVARRFRAAGLSAEAARWVDARTTRHLGRQAWTRFTETLEARIKAADPVLAERRRRAREATRRVSVSRTNDEGLKSLTVLLPAAQIILVRARIHQIALILKSHGATDALAQLEADAAFLLCTNPLAALQYLITAAGNSQPAGEHAPQPNENPPGDGSAAERDFDDPHHLFDDRLVRGREGSPAPGDDWYPGPLGPNQPRPDEPATDEPPDGVPQQRPPGDSAAHGQAEGMQCTDPPADSSGEGAPQSSGLIREAALHPSQRDDSCPTCGHAPARPAWEGSARTQADSPSNPLVSLQGLDAGKLRPRAVLYLHASEIDFRAGTGVVRFENDGIAFSHAEAVALLGHCHVKITRVIDLADHQPVDAYEAPDRLAEQVRLAHPTAVFPYAATSSRAAGVDLDHLRAYVPLDQGGEPGQTSLDNLAPLGRGSHRVKTHGRGWSLHNPLFGVHLWRTPHGYCFQRDAYGTTPLGKMTAEEFAQHTRDLGQEEDWDRLDDELDTA